MAEESPAKREARLEAAAKLGSNHERILNDILTNSGILRVSHYLSFRETDKQSSEKKRASYKASAETNNLILQFEL